MYRSSYVHAWRAANQPAAWASRYEAGAWWAILQGESRPARWCIPSDEERGTIQSVRRMQVLPTEWERRVQEQCALLLQDSVQPSREALRLLLFHALHLRLSRLQELIHHHFSNITFLNFCLRLILVILVGYNKALGMLVCWFWSKSIMHSSFDVILIIKWHV